jgi:endonuclease/exonuclease/phosphatase (EEP) superfamily protein YafD
MRVSRIGAKAFYPVQHSEETTMLILLTNLIILLALAAPCLAAAVVVLLRRLRRAAVQIAALAERADVETKRADLAEQLASENLTTAYERATEQHRAGRDAIYLDGYRQCQIDLAEAREAAA